MMHSRMEKRFWTSLSLNKNLFAVRCSKCTPGRQVPAVPHQVALPMAPPHGQPKVPKVSQGPPNIVLMGGEFPHKNFSASIFEYF